MYKCLQELLLLPVKRIDSENNRLANSKVLPLRLDVIFSCTSSREQARKGINQEKVTNHITGYTDKITPVVGNVFMFTHPN